MFILIPKNPPENKWGTMAKASVNKVLSKTKNVLRLIVKTRWRDKIWRGV